jgi:predicted phage tail protein
MVAAVYTGGLAATALSSSSLFGFGSMVAGVATFSAIALGGTMLLNYALPVGNSNSSETDSTYSWSGPVATIRQGAVIPKIYGKTRVTLSGTPIASYTIANGRQQYLSALY